MQTSDFIKEIHFNNTKELFQQISPFGEYKHVLKNYIFRGESSATFELIPSALRENNKSKLYSLSGLGHTTEGQSEWEYLQQRAEFSLLKKFFKLADDRGIVLPDIPVMRNEILNIFPQINKNDLSKNWVSDELLELAALAQHYQVPTRLIDWSLNYMTALYFAVSGVLSNEKIDEEDNMVLWALNYREIESLKNTEENIPIRLIKPTYNRNPNILCQNGVLSCWEYENFLGDGPDSIKYMGTKVNRAPLDELLSKYVLGKGIHLLLLNKTYKVLLYKFYLPIKEAPILYNALIDLKFGADSIFSGFNGVLQRMKDDALSWNQ